MVASHCGGNRGWLVESDVEESGDGARIRDQNLGSHLEVRIVTAHKLSSQFVPRHQKGLLIIQKD